MGEKQQYWWEKEPLRIVEITASLGESKEISERVESEVKILKKLKANVCHFHCMMHTTPEISGAGMNEYGFLFRTKLAARENPDHLAAFLPLAHQAGIRVIVYFNVHWYRADFGHKHPEWIQIKEDGLPVNDMYQTGLSPCINSPFRDWVFQLLTDLCAYDIDGIFFDGPIFHRNSCYCLWCQQSFAERGNQKLPKKSDRSEKGWKNLIEFQFESVQKFLADSRKTIHQLRPDVLLCMNGNSNWPGWTTGVDNHRNIVYTDLLGAEGGFLFGDLNQVPVYKPGVAAKLQRTQSQGKPVVVFDCAGWKPWSLYTLSAAEISLLLAETLSGGGNYWVAFFEEDLKQRDVMEVVRRYNSLVARFPEVFCGTESMADVALVWPCLSAEFYAGSSVPLRDFTPEIKTAGIGDISQEFQGFYELLVRSHTVFDVIEEVSTTNLSRYRLLVLPNVACLDNSTVARLKDFVQKGGNLVASFETSLYDAYGERLERMGLEEVFGIECTGSVLGPFSWDYLSPVTGSNLLKGITKNFLPSPQYGLAVKAQKAIALINFRQRMKGRYDGIPELSDYPFALVNQYGQGTAVYLAGIFGTAFFRYHFPEYLQLMKNICQQFSSMPVMVKSTGEIEVNLRRNREKIYLHLINMTAGLKRPVMGFTPLREVKVIINKNLNVSKVRSLNTKAKIAVKSCRQGTIITIPQLGDYEILEGKK